MYNKKLAQYQRTRVETSGKLDLVILCYEKALQALHEAKSFFEQKEFEKKARKLQLVLDIIYQLRSSLNFEKGGQIAVNLDAIYDYMIRRLLQGDVKKDLSGYDEVIRLLSELKEAWDKIAAGQEENAGVIPSPPSEKINISQLAA